MSTSTPSLETMPDEILSNIAGSFIVKYSFGHYRLFDEQGGPFNQIRSGLEHLSVCSKRLHDITTPFLFHTISQTQRHALPCLIKRLLAAPQSGRFVKRIFDSTRIVGPLDVSDFTEEDFTRCADIFREAAQSDAMTEFVDGLKRGDWDPFIALLLCQTPCLEYIELLGQGGYPKPVFMDEVFKKSAKLQARNQTKGCSLSRLRAASTYYHDTEGGMGINSIELFIRLKSMEKVRGHMLVLGDGSLVDTTHIYHLKELHISGAVDGEELGEFLSCFKSLERLTYRHGGCLVGHARFLPHEWGDAISHLTGTLEFLELTGDEIAEFDEDDQPAEALGPLVDFECLKELVIHREVLLGPKNVEYFVDIEASGSEDERQTWRLVDVFPMSLERLTVYECDEDFLEQMVEVLSQKKVVPALEFLEVRADYAHSHIGRPLAKTCKAAGVELAFYPRGSYSPALISLGDSDNEEDRH